MRIPDKAAFSRRRFCRLLAAAPLIVVLQKEGAPLPAPVPHVLGDADILQAQGIRLLRQGLRFERAARYLALTLRLAAPMPAVPPRSPTPWGSRFA